MPNTDSLAGPSFTELTIDHVRQHIMVDNKQKDNKSVAIIDRNTITSIPSLPRISKRLSDTVLQAELTANRDEGMNTGRQEKCSTRFDRRSNNSLHTANSAKSTKENCKILQPRVEAESAPAENIETDTHDTIRTNLYQTFYNHRQLSLCLNRRYFSQNKSITEEEDFLDLNKLFLENITEPEPVPSDESSNPGLFDKLLEDIRHAKDPKYRTLVTITAFWEEIRAQLREEDLKTTRFEDEAGFGLGIIFPSETIAEPKQPRIAIKKASGPPAQAFGDPNYLQEVRDHLMKRNQRKILEMSGNRHPLRAQTLTPSPRASEVVAEPGTGAWSMKGKLQEVIEQLQLKTSMII